MEGMDSVDLFRSEILGYERLRDLARKAYGDRDPMDRFFEGEPYTLIKEDGEYRLAIKLPFLGKKDVELGVTVALGDGEKPSLSTRYQTGSSTLGERPSHPAKPR